MHLRLRVRKAVSTGPQKFISKVFKSSSRIKNKKKFQPLPSPGSDLSKATTTELVKFVFKSVFQNQIDNLGNNNDVDKFTPCGVCDKCQLPDCGICGNCTKKTKFGGEKQKKRIICKNKRCLKFGPDFDIDLDKDSSDIKSSMRKNFSGTSEPLITLEGRIFYKFIKFGKIVIKPGDYVLVNPDYKGELLVISQIQYIYSYQTDENLPMFHSRLLCRGSKTILGECADPCELFITDTCSDYFYYQFVRKLTITFRKSIRNWSKSGNSEILPTENEEDGLSYFFSRKYDSKSGTFTHYAKEIADGSFDSCCGCRNRADLRKFNTPDAKVVKNQPVSVEWKGDQYRTGTCVFLDPKIYNLNVIDPEESDSDEELDEDVHTEIYRKKFTIQKRPDVPDPFCIGRIEKIANVTTGKSPKSQKTKIQITVRLFFRPENTRDGKFLKFYKNLNAVYWSDIVVVTPFDNVCGVCHLRYFESEEEAETWGSAGPHRFYFTEHYRADLDDYLPVPKEATRVGNDPRAARPADWPTVGARLKCMDLFAGCGGLSAGFHRSGLSETRWAVEKDQAAAEAFRLNNPQCRVLTGDCNKLLKRVVAGDGGSLGFPGKGEVDLLVAGSPCQGYSSLNRFNTGDASLLSNALIASCLSYCDYYRPKYFVLENVRNIVASKFTIIIKLVIKCLLLMDYQLTLGVLQAGHYGVPQSRRRFILIAAAPGFNLPKLPEPITVFNSTGGDNLLQIKIDGIVYENDFRWLKSAPFRNIMIRDAISDLPLEVPDEANVKVQYVNPPDSTFQKTVRTKEEVEVDDHSCRKLQEIDKLRISLIPKKPGADWRDLPNIGGTLKSGRKFAKIQYTYCTKKQDPCQPPRGVCECAIGGPCIAPKSDVITIIPWFLPHTGDRHNHFAGVYGRLDWDGCFGTSLTNPNPMTKQGKVIHPEADRILSVREAARSQGFPDKYKFFGNISDRYKQIGNAVPPPLAFAIGQEIKAAIAKS